MTTRMSDFSLYGAKTFQITSHGESREKRKGKLMTEVARETVISGMTPDETI